MDSVSGVLAHYLSSHRVLEGELVSLFSGEG